MTVKKLSKREARTLIKSLASGVTPRIGLRHIAVGRKEELDVLSDDLDDIEYGGASFRFICGEYGSGKSFMLQLMRNHALDNSFVVMDADLTPERRLAGSKRQGVSTYVELMKNVAIKSKPDGGALEIILSSWITRIKDDVMKENAVAFDDPECTKLVTERIHETAMDMLEMVCGFDFGVALANYWKGYADQNDDQKEAALRWMRGEYVSKIEARKDLYGIEKIIDDQNWYDFLKLFASFVKKAGYKGLLVLIDEGDNLYKISSSVSRRNNYEKLLTIFNDTMQGQAHDIGFFFSGTPRFIYDEKRGICSYEALKSRIITKGVSVRQEPSTLNPIVSLKRLTNEEIFVLLGKLGVVAEIAKIIDNKPDKKEVTTFMNALNSRIGGLEHITIREIIKAYIGVLDQLKTETFANALSNMKLEVTEKPDTDELNIDPQFADFTI